jgi:hypothetical protein
MKKFTCILAFVSIAAISGFAANHSGTISANEIWTLSNSPHHITGQLTINDGVTVTIEPGCQVYFDGNFQVRVFGALNANGTSASHILFTSNQAIPAKGDWRRIYFNAADAGTILNYCDILYGGSTTGSLVIAGSTNNVIISNSTITNSAGYGIYLANNTANPAISDCSVNNCDNYPIFTRADRVKDITGTMSFTGNTPNAIWVQTGTINTGQWLNHTVPYILGGGNFTVADANILTINPGVNIRFDGDRQMNVVGSLVADGDNSNHIVFTTNSSTPYNGDWRRLLFNGSDAGTILDYCDISYGGSVTGNIDIYNSGSNVTITNCNITNSFTDGIYLRGGSSPSIKNTIITGSYGRGIYINGACLPTFGSNASEWNEIYGNNSYELRNGTLNVTAEYIYWGPTYCGDIPDEIFDDADQANLGVVDFTPWVDNAHGLPSFVSTWTGASSLIWNFSGNWDNGIPCEMIDVFVPKTPANQPIVISDEKCHDLTLEAGSQLTMWSGTTLNVTGDLFMEANVNGTASLVENGGFTVAGNKTVQFYVEADRWHYVSPPLSGQTANTFFDMYLYEWDVAMDEWDNISDETTPLIVGKGYKLWSSSIYPVYGPPGTTSVEFEGGTLNSGTISLPVTFAGGGWNFVGNPYPSAVDWDNLGWIKTNIDATIYVWDGVQYITWNGSVGDLTDGVIPAMQGFMVKATSAGPSLFISNNTRLHGVDPYKNGSVEQLLEISVTGNGYSDKAFVNFNENSTMDFDSNFDGYKIYGLDEAPQLYTKQGDNILRVNVMPEVTSGLFIPVGLEVSSETEYTIVVNGLTSFSEGVSVFLEDLKENLLIDLSEQIDYTFMASPLDDPNRFILHFGVLGVEEQPVLTVEKEKAVVIYSNENSIYIRDKQDNELKGNVLVYNIMGQEILNKRLENISLNKIDLYTETGYYVVKVFTDEGVYSQKVFIK